MLPGFHMVQAILPTTSGQRPGALFGFSETFGCTASASGRGCCAVIGFLFPAGVVNRIMEAFLVSTGIVALAEMGDKTQLLALVLAARFRKPWPIVLGILTATLVNHALAGVVGAWVTTQLGPDVLRRVLGVSFMAMAVWMLVPDKLDGDIEQSPRAGVFVTTVVAFFLAEMGDKTQIATVMLAARYPEYLLWVVAGTTFGMMLANAPVVWLGERITRRVPIRTVHLVSAVIFAVLGVVALTGWGS